MAEFAEVWKQWTRMCGAQEGCSKCQMRALNCNLEFPCNQTKYAPEVIEDIVMKWAKENPEPVYPTWKEWLEEQRVVVHFDSVDKYGTKVKWELTNKSNCHIPADIAEKLGLEPKEGT